MRITYTVVEDRVGSKTFLKKHMASSLEGAIAIMFAKRVEADRIPNLDFVRDIWIEDDNGVLIECEFVER
jgi:hypothetical protein